jgi:hypothetical protein
LLNRILSLTQAVPASYGFIPQDSNLRSIKMPLPPQIKELYRLDYAEKRRCSKQVGVQRVVSSEQMVLLPGMFTAGSEPGFERKMRNAQSPTELADVVLTFARQSRPSVSVPCLLEYKDRPAGSCVDDVTAVRALCSACSARLLAYKAPGGGQEQINSGGISALFWRVRNMEEGVLKHWEQKLCSFD